VAQTAGLVFFPRLRSSCTGAHTNRLIGPPYRWHNHQTRIKASVETRASNTETCAT